MHFVMAVCLPYGRVITVPRLFRTMAKSSYRIMHLAHDLLRAKQGDGSVDIDSTIQTAMQAVTLNSLALQQLDQIRCNRFVSVLPDDMRGLVDAPSVPHSELFGDIGERQKEAKTKVEVPASITLTPQKRCVLSF